MEDNRNTMMPQEMAAAAPALMQKRITEDRLRKFTETLQKYKQGKSSIERRIISSEQWWKLRNQSEEEKTGARHPGFRSTSGWLHNVLTSKHADAMDAFPAPTILPREQNDQEQAEMLSAIIPVILEQNYFERTYDAAVWQKNKTGTGAYKIIWDKTRLNGLGDIGIERVNLLNVFWEPGVTDIQKSRYFFHVELVDDEILKQMHPELQGKQIRDSGFTATKFLYDDSVSTDGKHTVIEVYYHGTGETGSVLHYCKYVGNTVLFASEDDPQLAESGLYDHGKYPYVFDSLFPVEGSPCGYGYVDLCRNPQTEIDLLNTAIINNAMAGATPRYFSRQDGNVNEAEFTDLTKTIVHVNGTLSEDSIRRIEHNSLDGAYLNVLEGKVQELRETAGNTETATGTASSGVTAASAIAALQEASGKTSRDATRGTYRAYCQIVELCIELIRQFYDAPRQFRITGRMGEPHYVSYDNSGLRPQEQMLGGQNLGLRIPTFDVRVEAQKKSRYSTLAQNEMAMQFFQLGMFNPQMTDQAMLCMSMMDFDGKDRVMQQIARNGSLFEVLQLMQQYAVSLAAKYGDQNALMQLQAIAQQTGGAMPQIGSVSTKMYDESKEPAHVEKAREQTANASQPDAAQKTGKEPRT